MCREPGDQGNEGWPVQVKNIERPIKGQSGVDWPQEADQWIMLTSMETWVWFSMT